MSLLEAVVLALVQAIGEFLPISSSAHLILTRWLFVDWLHLWPAIDESIDFTFDVALHAGTLLAVLIYFARTWIELVSTGLGVKRRVTITEIPSLNVAEPAHERKVFWLIVIATVPGAIAGKLLDQYAETKFRENYLIIGAALAIVGLLMWLADKYGSQRKAITGITAVDAIIVGIAQAFALIPGVSRSGSTISAGLARALNREAAARFSFLLLAPITAGAVLLKAHHLYKTGMPTGMALPFAVGVIVSALVGYAVIAFLLRYLQTHSLRIFVLYRVILGLVVIALAVYHNMHG